MRNNSKLYFRDLVDWIASTSNNTRSLSVPEEKLRSLLAIFLCPSTPPSYAISSFRKVTSPAKNLRFLLIAYLRLFLVSGF